jgi:magnesium-protoporphyrin O-methyltransferase
MFSPRIARRSLERYRRRGLDALETQMVAAAAEGGLAGTRVVEIGGGIGALQAELVEAGAERGEIVELVSSYEPYALELARDKGIEAQVTFRVEDVLEHPGAVERSDVVVLNRVVCCSRDGVELTGTAARLATRTLVLSFPRDRLLVRVGLRLMNGGMRVLRRSFRVFVHPRAAIVAAAEAEGLRTVAGERGFAWEFVALRRPA